MTVTCPECQSEKVRRQPGLIFVITYLWLALFFAYLFLMGLAGLAGPNSDFGTFTDLSNLLCGGIVMIFALGSVWSGLRRRRHSFVCGQCRHRWETEM